MSKQQKLDQFFGKSLPTFELNLTDSSQETGPKGTFLALWYQNKEFDWLEYSEKTNAAFCFVSDLSQYYLNEF
jgi:hypothetical protein